VISVINPVSSSTSISKSSRSATLVPARVKLDREIKLKSRKRGLSVSEMG
jgi:hypothetical protein